MKQMIWAQLGEVHGKRILDFGSGDGVTADHYAANNEVIAVEPDTKILETRWMDHDYTQIVGSTPQLARLESHSFDLILCHNVLEYVEDRVAILAEFARLLKPAGQLSLVKHNRAGRVMQMTVLLNNFDHARELLAGHQGAAAKFGAIRYFEDEEVERWCPDLKIVRVRGMRTFWDLQQNQEIQKDDSWQRQMLELEHLVEEREPYLGVAFFHHLTIKLC